MEKIEIEFHGPFATHNLPCYVCQERKAVFVCHEGYFQPCWECQKEGWELKRPKALDKKSGGYMSVDRDQAIARNWNVMARLARWIIPK